jgi:hypothetical protein
MIGQKCPKCGSSRIRLGYKQPVWPIRLLGIHELLCDHCNLLFKGFAIPATLKRSPKKRKELGREKAT